MIYGEYSDFDNIIESLLKLQEENICWENNKIVVK